MRRAAIYSAILGALSVWSGDGAGPGSGVTAPPDYTSGGTFTGTVVAHASRTGGYTPLGVLFDADETMYVPLAFPKHDLHYEWDFGDTAAGTWERGEFAGYSKNIDAGPWAAHVYNSPGVYTPKVRVWYGAASSGWVSLPAITVQDAASIDDTFVVAPDGDFTGAPAGTQIPSNSLATILGQALVPCLLTTGARPVRILLKRGTTVESVLGANGNTAGGLANKGEGSAIRLGAWGTGAQPIIAGTADTTGTILPIGRSSQSATSDIAISDIKLDSGAIPLTPSRTVALIGATNTNSTNVLIHRCTLRNGVNSAVGGDNSFITYSNPARLPLDNWIASENIDEPVLPPGGGVGRSQMSYYLGGRRLAIIGCHIEGPQSLYTLAETPLYVHSHNLRITQSARFCVIAHNTFQGPQNTRQHIKIHSYEYQTWTKIGILGQLRNPAVIPNGATSLDDTIVIPTSPFHAGKRWSASDTPPFFKCVQGGSVGSYEPAWDTSAIGAITLDGTVQWAYMGNDPDALRIPYVGFYTDETGHKSLASRNMLVRGNTFEVAHLNYSLAAGTSDQWAGMECRDLIIECNRWYQAPKAGVGNTGLIQIYLEIFNTATVRNNRIDMSNMASGRTAIIVECPTVPFSPNRQITGANRTTGPFWFEYQNTGSYTETPVPLFREAHWRRDSDGDVLPAYTTADTSGYRFMPASQFSIKVSTVVQQTFSVYTPTSAADALANPPCTYDGTTARVRVQAEALNSAITGAALSSLTLDGLTPKAMMWGTPKNITVYNNTFRCTDGLAGSMNSLHSWVSVGTRTSVLDAVQQIAIKNNLIYGPGYSRSIMTGTPFTSDVSNNSTTAQYGTDPLLDAAWKPGPGSYAIGAGTATSGGNVRDAFGYLRSLTTPTLGAVEA